jgi:hypothetical protein
MGVGCCVAWLGFLLEALSPFYCYFVVSFASLRGLESNRSVVIFGRICLLVDVEAGFIILNLKKADMIN